MTISDYIRYLSQRSACFDTTESTTKSNNNSSELVAKTASNETNKVANTINDTVTPQSAKPIMLRIVMNYLKVKLL